MGQRTTGELCETVQPAVPRFVETYFSSFTVTTTGIPFSFSLWPALHPVCVAPPFANQRTIIGCSISFSQRRNLSSQPIMRTHRLTLQRRRRARCSTKNRERIKIKIETVSVPFRGQCSDNLRIRQGYRFKQFLFGTIDEVLFSSRDTCRNAIA